MSRLSKGLGEYFLGTETKKFYRDLEMYAREFIVENERLRGIIERKRRMEISDLMVGKYIPNALDVAFIIYSTLTSSLPYGIILAEGIRNAWTIFTSPTKKMIKEMIRKEKEKCREREDLLRRIR